MGTRGWLMFEAVQDLGLMFRVKDRAARRHPPWCPPCILAHAGSGRAREESLGAGRLPPPPGREHWTWSRESLHLGPHQPRDVQVSSALPHPTEGVNCLLPSWGLCTEAGLGECLVTDQFWGDHHKLLGGSWETCVRFVSTLPPACPGQLEVIPPRAWGVGVCSVAYTPQGLPT